jgi:hypothetical protein
MTVYDQPVTTYSDTTPHQRVIADAISLIDPRDTPFLDAVGIDSARSKFGIRLNGYKIELLEDELDPLTGACNHTTTITTNATNFPVADATIFQDGHVILVDSEYMIVAAADVTLNTITVYSRTYGGTNATHLSTSAIEIVGMARLEGDDADYGAIVDITAPYNYTGIFQKAIKVTGTQQVISQYGIDDEFMYQSNKALPHLFRLVEKAAFHGVRDAGSASAPRSMGGLETFITNNAVPITTSITKTAVDALAELIYDDGGIPDLFVCNHAVANDLRTQMDTSSWVQVTLENTRFGMNAITTLYTQYAVMRVLATRFCPVSRAYMIDSGKVGFYTLRPWFSKELAVTGDSKKGEVISELSLMVANDKSHGKITGITS